MPNNYIASVTLYSDHFNAVEWPYSCGRQMLYIKSSGSSDAASQNTVAGEMAA